MKKIFDMNSPIMQEFEKLANLMFLNFLTLLCCIPVITAGAAFTALHAMCLKIVRKEEGYLLGGYFKAFRQNFRQATILWIVFLLGFLVVGVDFAVIRYATWNFPLVVRVAVFLVGILILGTAMFTFPMQARFKNTVFMTLKNAFKASLIKFYITILMVLLFFVEVLLILSGPFVAVIFLYGFSAHAYVSALLYNKFFLAMENMGEMGNMDEMGEEGEVGEND